MSVDGEMIRSTLQLPLARKAGWGEVILADVKGVLARARHDIRLDHHVCRPKTIRPLEGGREDASYPAISRDVATANFEAASADLMRVACSRPPALTYAQLQGRLCAEEGFVDRTEEVNRRPGRVTFDDYLEAWGELVELIVVKAEVGSEMLILSPMERHHWAVEAIGTVIDKARCTFLAPPGREHFAPNLHDNIGLMRLFLISREFREANSFDQLVMAPH